MRVSLAAHTHRLQWLGEPTLQPISGDRGGLQTPAVFFYQPLDFLVTRVGFLYPFDRLDVAGYVDRLISFLTHLPLPFILLPPPEPVPAPIAGRRGHGDRLSFRPGSYDVSAQYPH